MVCNQSSQPLPNWGDPPSTKSDSMFLQKSVPDIISIYIYSGRFLAVVLASYSLVG